MKKYKCIAAAVGLLCLLLFGTMVFKSISFAKPTPSYSGGVDFVSSFTAVVNDSQYDITLPYRFSDLSARTPVTLTCKFNPEVGESLYVKSVYTPIRVYVNGELLYEYGFDGTYPSFLNDPPTCVAFVPLDNVTENSELKIEYFSPTERSGFLVQPILLGRPAALLKHLLNTMGFIFVFSIVEIVCRILIMLISLIMFPIERKILSFFWLGMFAFIAGIWAFGECNFTGLFIKNSVLLYLLAFGGLFSLSTAPIMFSLNMVDFKNKRPIYALCISNLVAVAVAFALQLFGIVGLSRSMYFFHLFVPLSFLLLCLLLLYEGVHNAETHALRFFIPFVTLLTFTLLELLNYQFRFVNAITTPFQIGMILFILFTGFAGGLFIRDAMRMKHEQEKLAFDIELMEHIVQQQKLRQELMLESEAALRAQRHDLRHQLGVIHTLSHEGGNSALTSYIDGLLENIPNDKLNNYCENTIVNAVVSHYEQSAMEHGISFSVSLTVPAKCSNISDSSLCVLFGNMLENAIEACDRMTEGEKFIHLKSRLQYETLTITMDNSFNGKVSVKDEKFISSKRPEPGTGTASIKAVAAKRGGNAVFAYKDNVFMSSVYVRI